MASSRARSSSTTTSKGLLASITTVPTGRSGSPFPTFTIAPSASPSVATDYRSAALSSETRPADRAARISCSSAHGLIASRTLQARPAATRRTFHEGGPLKAKLLERFVQAVAPTPLSVSDVPMYSVRFMMAPVLVYCCSRPLAQSQESWAGWRQILPAAFNRAHDLIELEGLGKDALEEPGDSGPLQHPA